VVPGGTIWRKFLPPSYDEPLGDAQTRRVQLFKRWICLISIAIDIGILFGMRGVPQFSKRAVDAFASINIPLLTIDLVIGELAMRRARSKRMWRFCIDTCAIIEAFTILVWIQLTGSLTSYFQFAGLALILGYRHWYDYHSALVMAVALVVFHVGAVGLEAAGWLRPESLFVALPGGVYEASTYRVFATVSFLTLYLLAFGGGNLMVDRFREKDILIAEAHEQNKLGRFSGRTFASRYELDELLGRGGMGEIYHGRALEDGTEVAVKILHAHLCTDTGILERFRREAQAAARLPGRRIAQVIEAGRAMPDGEPYIVMEYLRGEDLGGYLRRKGRLSAIELVPIVREIASALEEAHDAGIVHRDLKPPNVFLTHDGRVVLLDFGISKIQGAGETLTATAEVLGSPGWMAPEQARGQLAAIGPGVDVFALAAIAFRALTGRQAFPSGDLASSVFEVCNVDPPPPTSLAPELPPAIDDVVALGLAKSVTKRYARAVELANDLAAAASGAALPADRTARARALRRDAELGATLVSGRG